MGASGRRWSHRRQNDRPAPEWNSNCCLTSPVRPSQMMAVLSTLPLSSRSPFLFHLSEKMGPLCAFSICFSSPAAPQPQSGAESSPRPTRPCTKP